MKKKCLVSACLLGIRCRYDGKSKLDKRVKALSSHFDFIPVCPEQLGGLPTPRFRSEIKSNGRVVNENGEDWTKNFIRGAKEVLKIAKMLDIKMAVLKERSPSCGVNEIYDGTFRSKCVEGKGITTRLLEENDIEVMSEEEITKKIL
ncbi:MAG: DUF523 domain-containing protein [Thermotogae bacterium]|nr:DUF523 domain-containing protein [Thermotogota bacterium]